MPDELFLSPNRQTLFHFMGQLLIYAPRAIIKWKEVSDQCFLGVMQRTSGSPSGKGELGSGVLFLRCSSSFPLQVHVDSPRLRMSALTAGGKLLVPFLLSSQTDRWALTFISTHRLQSNQSD